MTTPSSQSGPFPPSLPPVALQEARERAVRLLSDGYAYDRLSEREFEWRLERLGATDSPASVDALVADLLAPVPADGALLPLTSDERRLFAFMSNSRHEGAWVVPPRITLTAIMSEVRIDLRHAALPASVSIDLYALMANVRILVVPGTPVLFDVEALMATTRSDATFVPAQVGTPARITVRGHAMLSDVSVREREIGR